MNNSIHQAANTYDAFDIQGECLSGAVLLLDDMVDSKLTFTVCGFLLRQAGCGPVFPFALASTAVGGAIDP